MSGADDSCAKIADPAELSNYVGKNLAHFIDRDDDDEYCFRLHKDRWVSKVVRQADMTA